MIFYILLALLSAADIAVTILLIRQYSREAYERGLNAGRAENLFPEWRK